MCRFCQNHPQTSFSPQTNSQDLLDFVFHYLPLVRGDENSNNVTIKLENPSQDLLANNNPNASTTTTTTTDAAGTATGSSSKRRPRQTAFDEFATLEAYSKKSLGGNTGFEYGNNMVRAFYFLGNGRKKTAVENEPKQSKQKKKKTGEILIFFFFPPFQSHNSSPPKFCNPEVLQALFLCLVLDHSCSKLSTKFSLRRQQRRSQRPLSLLLRTAPPPTAIILGTTRVFYPRTKKKKIRTTISITICLMMFRKSPRKEKKERTAKRSDSFGPMSFIRNSARLLKS